MAGEYILIVDDEELICKQADVALRRNGYRTATASNAAQALELIRTAPPDLLLSDIRMDETDGLQLFAQARKLQPDLVGVMMTAYGSIDTAIKALQLGVQGFLQKPFTGSELERVIQDALHKSRTAQEAVRLRVLSPLFEARRMLVPGLDLASFCRTLAEVTVRETDSDYCAIFLVEDDPVDKGPTENVRQQAVYSKPAAKALLARNFPAGKLASRAIEQGRTLSLRRNVGTNELPGQPESTIPGVIIAVPLLLGSSRWGALLVGRMAVESKFSTGERELFEILAGQLATLVENRRLFEALTEREDGLRRFVNKFVTGQENERHKLADRLNDTLMNTLTTGRKNIQSYIEKVRPAANTELLAAEQKFKDAISEARNLMNELRPANLDEYGLTAALRQYIHTLNEGGLTQPNGQPCRVNFALIGPETPRLDSAIEIALFRAIQEAIGNACKHASTTQVEVSVRVVARPNIGQHIQIEVRDWGKGFDLQAVKHSSQYSGLLAMQERVNLVGAKCHIESTPGKGTVVTFTYDLPE